MSGKKLTCSERIHVAKMFGIALLIALTGWVLLAAMMGLGGSK